VRQASQLLQATGLAYAVESDLRRAPHCSMVLPWQLAESYPNAWCTAAIEYYGDIKPSYQAVRRAFEERRVSLKLDRAAWSGCSTIHAQAWVWANSHDPVDADSCVTLSLKTLGGQQIAADSWHISAVNSPVEVGTLSFSTEELARVCGQASREPGTILVWMAQWTDKNGDVIDKDTVFFSTGKDWSALCDVPEGEVHVSVEADATDESHAIWNIQISNTGNVALVGIDLRDDRPARAQGFLRTLFNPMTVMPGESRALTAVWDGVDTPERSISLYAWNLAPRHIREQNSAEQKWDVGNPE
jgi:beta-mannosidase